MRSRHSDNLLLPFYSSRKAAYKNQCGECSPAIKVRNVDEAPHFQLILPNGSTHPSTFELWDACSNMKVKDLSYEIAAADLSGDGNDEVVLFWNGGVSVASGLYYLRLHTLTGLDNGLTELFSEDFCVCPTQWRIEYKNNCDSLNGLYSTGYVHSVQFKDIEFLRPIIEDITDETTNGKNETEIVGIIRKIKENFDVKGADYFYQGLKNITLFDVVELVNDDTGERIDIKKDFDATTSGDQTACEYPIKIEFTKNIIEVDSCCTSVYDDSPYDECNPNNPPCDDYEVFINADVPNTLLTLVEADIPLSTTPIITWTLDGVFIGSGTSVSLGAYGTYRVSVIRGECMEYDEFVYVDPCAGFHLLININAPVISGGATGDTNITYSIQNSEGTEVATSLPYTVLSSDFYTVIATGDNCTTQSTWYVEATPPGVPPGPPGQCTHSVTVEKVGDLITGSTSGCSGTIDSEFIELETENGSLTVVSSTNTHLALVTGIYWYNAVCDGCLQRIHTLVIVEETNQTLNVNIVNDCLPMSDCDCPSAIQVGVGGTYAGCEDACVGFQLRVDGLTGADTGGIWSAPGSYTGPPLVGDNPTILWTDIADGNNIFVYQGQDCTGAPITEEVNLYKMNLGSIAPASIDACENDSPINIIDEVGTLGPDGTPEFTGVSAGCIAGSGALSTVDPSCLGAGVHNLTVTINRTPPMGATDLGCCDPLAAILTITVSASVDPGIGGTFTGC